MKQAVFRLRVDQVMLPGISLLAYRDVHLIGDTPPLSWHSSHCPMSLINDLWTAKVPFSDEFGWLTYKYLIRLVSKEGREFHLIENSCRILELDSETHFADDIFSSSAFVSDQTSLHEKPACSNLYTAPIVASDGTVTFCCRDSNLESGTGNLSAQPLSDIWEGNRMNYLRLQQLRGDFRNPPCCSCTASVPVEQQMLESFLSHHGVHDCFQEYLHRTSGRFYLPLYVQLELSGQCRLSCKWCSQGLHNHENRGFMPLELFKTILERDLRGLPFPVKRLSLFWFGEPLLHPDFPLMLALTGKAAREKPFYEVLEVHTSGQDFTADIQDAVMRDPPPGLRLVFSIDASRPETYRSLKGGEIDTVLSNVRYLLKNHACADIQTVFQFIVHPENCSEANEFYSRISDMLKENRRDYQVTAWEDFVKPFVIRFRFCDPLKPEDHAVYQGLFQSTCDWVAGLPEHRVMYCPEYIPPESIPAKPGFRPFCPLMLSNPSIRSDGTLTFCCHDTEGLNAVGSLACESFHELWFEKAWKGREDMLRGDLSSLPACRDCAFYSSPNRLPLNEYWLFRFLERSGRKNLIVEYLNRKRGG
ncbi:MAG: SPASM domain-containing protein [Candidatus Wallbacteria bacterium]|nr:SPASM domain-containing protein [Candidatus Wallbacteria bacterium]